MNKPIVNACKSLFENVGQTPLVLLTRLWDSHKTGVRVLAKLEGSNPGGSVKDRTAQSMIRDALARGVLTPDRIILEPTSGNTGIGLAMVAAHLGFRIKLLMPACVSTERRSILQALGAELELTPGCEKTDGAIRRAHAMMDKEPGKYFMPDQFSNPANCMAHYNSTAPELVEQTQGEMDWFVAGMGTTGTVMGCSMYFRDHNPRTKVAGVEPERNHRIQGLKNMEEAIVPAIYRPELLDQKITCSDENAFNTVRDLALMEGLFCGISSGAAVWGAIQIAKQLPSGSTVVALLPDRGDRYLSSEMFRSVCAACPP